MFQRRVLLVAGLLFFTICLPYGARAEEGSRLFFTPDTRDGLDRWLHPALESLKGQVRFQLYLLDLYTKDANPTAHKKLAEAFVQSRAEFERVVTSFQFYDVHPLAGGFKDIVVTDSLPTPHRFAVSLSIPSFAPSELKIPGSEQSYREAVLDGSIPLESIRALLERIEYRITQNQEALERLKAIKRWRIEFSHLCEQTELDASHQLFLTKSESNLIAGLSVLVLQNVGSHLETASKQSASGKMDPDLHSLADLLVSYLEGLCILGRNPFAGELNGIRLFLPYANTANPAPAPMELPDLVGAARDFRAAVQASGGGLDALAQALAQFRAVAEATLRELDRVLEAGP